MLWFKHTALWSGRKVSTHTHRISRILTSQGRREEWKWAWDLEPLWWVFQLCTYVLCDFGQNAEPPWALNSSPAKGCRNPYFTGLSWGWNRYREGPAECLSHSRYFLFLFTIALSIADTRHGTWEVHFKWIQGCQGDQVQRDRWTTSTDKPMTNQIQRESGGDWGRCPTSDRWHWVVPNTGDLEELPWQLPSGLRLYPNSILFKKHLCGT